MSDLNANVDYILAADHEDGDDGSNKSDDSAGDGDGGDEEEGGGGKAASQSNKKGSKNGKNSKNKKKKANDKKKKGKNGKKKKKENGEENGGRPKPYTDYTDEAPDMLKFDDDDDDHDEVDGNKKKGGGGGGAYAHVIGSDEDDEDEDSSEDDSDSDSEDSDSEDGDDDSEEEESSDDSEDSSDGDNSSSLQSIDSDDVRNIRDRAHGLIDEDSVQARVRIRKKREKRKKREAAAAAKKKKAKSKSKKKRRRRKARASERSPPGPGLWSRMSGAFQFPRSWKRGGGAAAASEDERVPMTALDAQGMSGGGGGGGVDGGSAADGGRSYGDWDPRESVGATSVNAQRDFDDLDGSVEGGIRVYDSVRYVDPRAKRRRRKRCCLFFLVLLVMTGAGLAIWFEWGNFGNLKKLFHREGKKGKGKGKSDGGGGSKPPPSGGAAAGKGSAPKGVPPFDVYADVTGICSDEDVATFQGYYACRGLCDSAYCCFLPPWESHSCTRTFDNQCRPYVAACAVLDRVEQPRSPGASGGDNGGQVKENALPPADPNLPYLCSGKDTTKSGLEKCSAACKTGLCCFASMSEFGKENDCYMDNKYACAAYHPCIDAVSFQGEIENGGASEDGGVNVTTADGGSTIVHLHNWKFERRRLILEQACSKRGMVNSGACERYCVGYECCYGEEKGADTADTCHDEKTCMDMAACANLLTPGGRP